jgi:hypothetical protein
MRGTMTGMTFGVKTDGSAIILKCEKDVWRFNAYTLFQKSEWRLITATQKFCGFRIQIRQSPTNISQVTYQFESLP